MSTYGTIISELVSEFIKTEPSLFLKMILKFRETILNPKILIF